MLSSRFRLMPLEAHSEAIRTEQKLVRELLQSSRELLNRIQTG
jgi:hypothetical protein